MGVHKIVWIDIAAQSVIAEFWLAVLCLPVAVLMLQPLQEHKVNVMLRPHIFFDSLTSS